MRRLSLGLALVGLVLGTCLIGWYGFGAVIHATLSVGFGGFGLVCAWQVGLFATLGLAWFVLRPAAPSWRLPAIVWGRMVRDAAGGLLPFSLVGGFVIGARAITLYGVTWPTAAASTVVDLTTEFLAQIGLVVIGLVILSARSPNASVTFPVAAGLLVAVVSLFLFIWLQRGANSPVMRVLGKLSHRILGGWGDTAETQLATIQVGLNEIYATPWRVGLGIALHLLAWFGTGGASFIAFRLLGAHLDFWDALGIEALLHAVLASAILVPGYAGVQEAAYAGVGALFVQPPELALGVSLLRRARDIALGVPILLIWQFSELRRRKKLGG
jgi:putative membrane protein